MNALLKKLCSITPFKLGMLITFAVIGLYFINPPFMSSLESKALDLRMLLKGGKATGGETIIAAIDEKSIGELGQWPWSRAILAKLVDTLNKDEARVIAFDMVFAQPEISSDLQSVGGISKTWTQQDVDEAVKKSGAPDTLKQQVKVADAEFAEAIKQSASSTLGYFFHISNQEIESWPREAVRQGISDIIASKYPVVQFRSMPKTVSLIEACAATTNIPLITEAAENAGYLNAFPDKDGGLRWAPLVIRLERELYPSLALSALLQYLDWPILSVIIGEKGIESIKLGDTDIRTDNTGRMLINYRGPEKTFSHFSISDILNNRINSELIKDKIVLIGPSAKKLDNPRITPFSASLSDVEVHANIIDTILQGDFIRPPSWNNAATVATILLCGLFTAVLIPKMTYVKGLLCGITALLTILSVNFYFFRHDLWLNLSYPLLTILLVYAGATFANR